MKTQTKKARLTTRTAMADAVQLWGPNAAVQLSKCRLYLPGSNGRSRGCSGLLSHGAACPGGKRLCQVGTIELGAFFMVRGDGSTFEEAFARAALRDHRMGCIRENCPRCAALKQAIEATP